MGSKMILKKYRFNIYQVNQKTKEVELKIGCVTKYIDQLIQIIKGINLGQLP